MSIPQEYIYFQDINATVTSQRVIIAGRFYPTANITSVGVTVLPRSNIGGWVMIAVGVLTSLCFLLSFVPDTEREVRTLTGGYFPSLGVIGLGIGLGLIAGGILFMTLRKPKYLLRIGSSYLESDALISPDRGYLEAIAVAINNALPRR